MGLSFRVGLRFEVGLPSSVFVCGVFVFDTTKENQGTMKTNEDCCHFVMVTDDNELK